MSLTYKFLIYNDNLQNKAVSDGGGVAPRFKSITTLALKPIIGCHHEKPNL